MKKSLLLLFTVLTGLCISNYSFSQAPDWTRMLQVSTYGMQNVDAVSADAGFVYSATSISGSVNIGLEVSSTGLRDMLLFKTSNDQTVQWWKQFDAGAGGTIYANAIKTDPSGFVYVTGFLSGTVTFGAGITLFSDATHNAFMVKFESDGDALWATSFLNTGTGAATKMAFDAGSNIYLLSRTRKLIKFSSSGVIQWEQEYPNTVLQAVEVYGSNLYLGGTLRSSTVNFGATPLAPLGGSYTGFLVKADLDGVFTSSLVVGGSTTFDGSSVTDIVTDNSGNLIITGSYTDDLILGAYTVNNSAEDYYNYTYIAKCNDAFEFTWATSSSSYYNSLNEMLNFRVFRDNSGNIYEYGMISTSFSYGTVPVGPQSYPFLVAFNSSGVPQASRQVEGTSVNRTYVAPSGLIFTGGSYAASGDPNFGNFYLNEYSNSGILNWKIITTGSSSGTCQIRNVKVDGAGNTYIQARILGKCDYFGTEINTTVALTVLSKHDYNGDMIWMRQIADMAPENYGPTFILDKDNNVLLVGLFQSILNIEHLTLYASTTGREAYVAKYDGEDGQLKWAQSAGLGTDIQPMISVASDTEGNVIFSGSSEGSNFLQKYGPDGDYLWSDLYPMDSYYFSLVSTDGSNNIFMASEVHLTSSPVMIGTVSLSQTSDDGATVLVKLDPDGTPLWAKTYGGVTGAPSADGWPTEIVSDSDGNTYLYGWCFNNAKFDSYTLTNPLATPALYSYYLTKIDENGSVIWVNGIYETGSYSFNYGDVMDLDENGNIYVGGHFRNKINIQGNEYPVTGTIDFFTAKFANDGTFDWIKTIPSSALICYSLDVSVEDVVTIGSAPGKDGALGTFPYERLGGSTGVVATMGDLPYANVTSDDPEFIAAPESSACTFTIASNTSWTVVCDQPWLTPDAASGTGDATITLSANANTTHTYREANVLVSANGSPVKEIFVVQFGIPLTSFPYTEDFTTYPPTDWNLEEHVITWEPYNSSAVYANLWDNDDPARAVMVTPIFDFTALDNPEVNFTWSHKYQSPYNDGLKIEVYADGPEWETVWLKSGSALNSNDGAQNEAPGTYTTTSLNLSAYAAKPSVLLRFTAISDYGPNIYIDQVVVYNGVKSAPEAVTGNAFYAYYDQAYMSGTVNPHSAATSITFEYGLTTGYGTTVNASPAQANGSIAVPVYYFLSGLTPNTTYHYRVVAVNSLGTVYGDDKTFTTSGCDRIEYTTANEAGTYTDIGTNGTVITTASFDDANSAPQDIGFTFNYNCQDFTQFVLNTNGFIKLGSAPPSAANKFFSGNNTYDGIFSSMDPADVNILAPFTVDLMAGTFSPEYRVYTSGVAPDRICTIQYENVSDKAGIFNTQYDNISFQIKLYETSNVIEFVYGTWIASANPSTGRSSECGIKGSAPVNDHLITVTKSSVSEWSSVAFQHSNYPTGSNAFNFGNPPARPAPDPGRTIRFAPSKNQDATVAQVYTLTKMPIPITGPHQIKAAVKNVGLNVLTDINVTLTVSGANSFTDSYIITSLNANSTQTIAFDAFTATVPGDNVVTVTVEDDENNGNNSRSVNQKVTSDTYSYAEEGYTSGSVFYSGLTLSRFSVTGARMITGVNVRISNDLNSIGNTVYCVVTDRFGNITGQSANHVIATEDMGKMLSFSISNPPLVSNDEFLAGLACTPPVGVPYYPVSVQNENPVRPGTYYVTSLGGGILSSNNNRFITEIVVSVPSIVVSDNTLTIDQPEGSTETFTITSNMNWNVGSSQAWLTASKWDGSRDAVITLTAEENTTGSDRYATITVSGADGTTHYITVTQAGLATGIEKPEAKAEIRLYPNPNRGRFTIDMDGLDYERLRITVTTLAGVVVKDLTLNGQSGVKTHEIDLGGIAGGLYFIKMQTESFNSVKMFVVE